MNILFLALVFTAVHSYGQHVTIGLDKMNMAYVGVDNPVSITSDSYACDQLLVTTDNGKITGQGCDHNFSPDKIGVANINVYAQIRGEKKRIGGLRVSIRNLPTPVISIADRTEGYISKLQLLKSFGPGCTLPNCDYDIKYTITNYSIIITHKNGEQIFRRSYAGDKTNSFDDETRNVFGTLKRDDKIEIADIHITGPDNVVRSINNLKLAISN